MIIPKKYKKDMDLMMAWCDGYDAGLAKAQEINEKIHKKKEKRWKSLNANTAAKK